MSENKMSLNVAVIVLTYGDYSGLKRTITSILKQSCPIQTIILTDDGSENPFPEDIVTMLREAPCQVVIRQGTENLGTTAHMNLVANMCDNTFLKFIASGDAFSDEDALGAMVLFAQETGATVISSNALVCSPDLTHQYYKFPGSARGTALQNEGMELFRVLAKANIISAAGALFHRDFFGVMGGFDSRYRLLEDWPTWLRLARTGYAIPFLDRVTCLYALGGISSQSGNAFCSEKLRADMLCCYEHEILPELKNFSKIDGRLIRYHYEMLKTHNSWNLWSKYFDLHILNQIKRGIKWVILKGNMSFKNR